MWILLKLLLIGLRLAPTARRDLILENLALRHQLAVCARPRRPRLREADRRFWSSLARGWPAWRHALVLVQPETVVQCHYSIRTQIDLSAEQSTLPDSQEATVLLVLRFAFAALRATRGVALHFQYYNFARPHASLDGWTPAMAAGISDHMWDIDEIVELLEAREGAAVESSH